MHLRPSQRWFKWRMWRVRAILPPQVIICPSASKNVSSYYLSTSEGTAKEPEAPGSTSSSILEARTSVSLPSGSPLCLPDSTEDMCRFTEDLSPFFLWKSVLPYAFIRSTDNQTINIQHCWWHWFRRDPWICTEFQDAAAGSRLNTNTSWTSSVCHGGSGIQSVGHLQVGVLLVD